eukprot:CAMPEP_0116578944 /NCGR_PEP_ID=MMETSP0397-20121206/21989_1 /TAXON_ID=216820 /ORGANISM="Cyclophora tenuis, Strain ECT3854" /LENGTH=299 /DNA_ID=CAMNT_0004108393 /DNA_START=51 /DNA_END=950 /DNA_ORIENTATION=+
MPLNLCLDGWMNVLPFLTLPDVATLTRCCKDVRDVLSDDVVYSQFARLQYPPETLEIGSYGSWKDLVKDDNAEAGIRVLNVNAVSEWHYNKKLGRRLFYVNSVRLMVWDRRARSISLLVEAYGNTDLRTAHTTSIFRVNGDADVRVVHLPFPMSERRHPPGRVLERSTCRDHTDIANVPSYKLCFLHFPESSFAPTTEPVRYMFTYNGSRGLEGTDYPCVDLTTNFTCLKELFSVENGAKFCARDSFEVGPSDVKQWEVSTIPESILARRDRGEWGRCTMVKQKSFSRDSTRKLQKEGF